MITHYWLEKGISTLLLLVFAFLAFLSFGYPAQFDWLFIAFLIFLTATFKRNPDIASIAFVLLLVRFLSHLAFYYQGDYQALVLYALSFAIAYKFKFDSQISYILLPVLVICSVVEIYWYVVGYPSPQLSVYVVGIAINCLLRTLLTYRAHMSNYWPNVNLKGVSLDFDLYRLTGVYNVVVLVMIVEYLVRHLTPLNPLFVYHAYSYCLQLITLLFPYLVISYLIKSKFTINA